MHGFVRLSVVLHNFSLFRDDSEIIVHSDDCFAPVVYLKLKSFHLEDKKTPSSLNLDCLNPQAVAVNCSSTIFNDKLEVI